MRAEALGKITMAALNVFAEYGFHGATMKKITQATGLSYGLVYHYFPSKEEIFTYVVDSSLDASIMATMQVLEAPGTAWEKIEYLSSFLVREALNTESSPYFLVVLQANSVPGFADHVAEKISTYYKTLAPLIREAQKSGDAIKGDPLVLAAAYFSFVQGLALLGVQKGDLEKKITPEILVNVLRNNQS